MDKGASLLKDPESAPGRQAERRRGWKNFRIFAVFGGQGAISLQTFIAAMVMIRSSTQSEFGLYTTILAGINFVFALQVALFVGPLLVISPTKPAGRRSSFTGSMLVSNALFSAATSALIFAAYALLRSTGVISQSHFAVLASGACYLAIYQAQEFFRRVLQLQQRFVEASICDFFALVVVALFLPLVFIPVIFPAAARFHFGFTASDGLLLLSVSGLTGLLLSIYRSREYIELDALELHAAVREAWTIGGWSMAGVLCDLMLTYSSTYIVAGTMGTAAVGRLEGPRLLVAPIQVFSNAVRSYLMPTVSALVAAGSRAEAYLKLRKAFLWAAVAIGAYCLTTGALPAPVIRYALGNSYAGTDRLLKWWAGSYFFLSLNAIPWIAVFVMRKVNVSATVTLILGCGVAAATWVAAHNNSLSGVLVARMVANFAFVATGAVLGRRYLRGAARTTTA